MVNSAMGVMLCSSMPAFEKVYCSIPVLTLKTGIPRSYVSSPWPSVSMTAITSMSYSVSGVSPVTSRLVPAAAGAKMVIGSPPSCGVNVIAYCVIFRGSSLVSSGGGSSQLRVTDLAPTSPSVGGSGSEKQNSILDLSE